MFWGLIMEPGRCYTQTVKVSFHVSMAALDISNSSDEPAQVMCVFEGRNYLLCTLNKKDKLQCPLDLNFETGTKVSFATNGKSHVHLTGYLTSMEDDFEEEEVEEEEATTAKDKKRLKELTEGPPKKKSRTIKNSIISSSIDVQEEESSDSDFDIGKLVKANDEEDEEEEDEDEGEEEEEEEEDELEEDEGGEEASSLSELESEEEEQTKPKQNGIAKASSTPLNKKKKEQEKASKEKNKKEEKKEQQQQQPKAKKSILKGGVVVQDLKEGFGEIVKNGKFVHVYYEGRLKENNKLFDSTTKGPGFSFRVGKGEVIKGWDTGLVGMKAGGKRRIICPPNVAYGPKGSPPVIPPNATLVFDVEVKKIS